jgi:hypothetical protein
MGFFQAVDFGLQIFECRFYFNYLPLTSKTGESDVFRVSWLQPTLTR